MPRQNTGSQFDIIVAVAFAVGENGEGIEVIVPTLQYVSIANDRLHLDHSVWRH